MAHDQETGGANQNAARRTNLSEIAAQARCAAAVLLEGQEIVGRQKYSILSSNTNQRCSAARQHRPRVFACSIGGRIRRMVQYVVPALVAAIVSILVVFLGRRSDPKSISNHLGQRPTWILSGELQV